MFQGLCVISFYRALSCCREHNNRGLVIVGLVITYLSLAEGREMSRYKAGWCFQEEGCSECLEVCSLVWGYLFFWRAGRTVVVIRWVVLDRTEHLILAVKCVVIEVIIALFLSGQVSGPCHFQLVLSPVILRGKISLKSLFFNPFALHLDLQVILLFHYWIDDSRGYYLCAKASFKKKNNTHNFSLSSANLLSAFWCCLLASFCTVP